MTELNMQEERDRLLFLNEESKLRESESERSKKELCESMPNFNWAKRGSEIRGSAKVEIEGLSERMTETEFVLWQVAPGFWKGSAEVKEITPVKEIHCSKTAIVNDYVAIARFIHNNSAPSALKSVEQLMKIASAFSGIEIKPVK